MAFIKHYRYIRLLMGH